MPDSSTYPLPPRHSSASATAAGRALADPELRQRQRDPAQRRLVRVVRGCRRRPRVVRPAPWPPRPRRRGRPARSASAACRSSSEPKAERCAACQVASLTARRISEVEPSTQSSRVAATISMMVRTPRPSSPSRCATRAVELQLRRRVGPVAQLVLEAYDVEAVARRRPAAPAAPRSSVTPPSACASTRKTSFIGAEVNHLCPCSVYSPSTDVRRASVTLARTSEPPCFSVIPMPASAPSLVDGARTPGS